MLSGTTGGIIEAWVDVQFIYRYVGDVNHGEPFEDLYLRSDGADIWRAGNAGSNGICGITSAINGGLNYVSNGQVVKSFSGVCKAGEIQPVLLHMVSGVSDGVIESWINGQCISRYVGDVNNGEDFNEIFMQCDGDGTVFFKPAHLV